MFFHICRSLNGQRTRIGLSIPSSSGIVSAPRQRPNSLSLAAFCNAETQSGNALPPHGVIVVKAIGVVAQI